MVAGSSMDGAEHGKLVFEQFKFELGALGFQIVESVDAANFVAKLAIGTIRNDPLGGWIADRGQVQFLDRSGKLAFQVQAQSQLITPSTDKIIASLVAGIKRELANR